MLRITGKCLGISDETVNGPRGSFVSTTVTLMTGEGTDTTVDHVRLGRDFPTADRPKDGDVVTLNVVVAAYAGKNGAGYRLTALSRDFLAKGLSAAS